MLCLPDVVALLSQAARAPVTATKTITAAVQKNRRVGTIELLKEVSAGSSDKRVNAAGDADQSSTRSPTTIDGWALLQERGHAFAVILGTEEFGQVGRHPATDFVPIRINSLA